MKTLPFIKLGLLVTLMLGGIGGLRADEPWFNSRELKRRVVRLDGSWRFCVGDGAERAAASFDDTGWSTIHAPDAWQDEGYRDYNGYAWYRKTFTLPSGAEQRDLSLALGRIDDVDEVFVNGQRVGGTGQFPPDYESQYDDDRIYPIPAACLKPGKQNVIAVRVYDGGGVGGIVDGRLGIYTSVAPPTEIPLDGAWKFSPGDNPDWKKPEFDDKAFGQITVPATWEDAGYPNLDGYAWYRKTFTVARSPEGQTLVLLLGKIDDYDEVYLNGVSIGSTGEIDHPTRHGDGRSYALSRAYHFPASLLKATGTNTIAVRVLDEGGYGGIYAGPVGIISQTEFVRYWESRRHHSVNGLLSLLWSDD